MLALTSQSRLILSPGFTVGCWPGSTLMIRKLSLLATSRDNIRTTELEADPPAEIFERQSTRGRERHDSAPLILKTPSQTMASSLLPLFVWNRIHMSPSFEYITTYAERHWPVTQTRKQEWHIILVNWLIFHENSFNKNSPWSTKCTNSWTYYIEFMKCTFCSQLSFSEKGCVKWVR